MFGMFAFLTACGSSKPSTTTTTATAAVNVTVTPNPANVVVGNSQAFTASVFGSSNSAVTWSVAEANGGTIDSSGNYTAPATPGTYHVVATSQANPADSGTAPVVVTALATGVQLVIVPSAANVIVGGSQAFTASQLGSSGTGVVWSVAQANGGTITALGNYTAPMTAGTYDVVATSATNASITAEAPVVVTVPQPNFTSVPPTAAAQDEPYTYTVSAADPARTNVTYALTTGPVGAVLSGGNTISWTPTAQQARQDNAFAVTATTAAGGSATQSWAVAPTGTVQGSFFFMYWSADGTVEMQPSTVTASESWAALIPQTDGSLTVLPGTGYPDGTFTIPNVPAGYYWLQFNTGDVVWTNASYLDYGADQIGHIQLPLTFQVFGCNLTGLDPFDPANDELVLYSVNAQAFQATLEDQSPSDPPPAPFPTAGSTICDADPTIVSMPGGGYSGDFGAIGAFSGISPSLGDVSTIAQIEAAPSGSLSEPFDQDFAIGPAVDASFDIEGQSPFPYPTFIAGPGALSNTSPQSQDFTITFSAWANNFNVAGPTQTQAPIPEEFVIILNAWQPAPALPRTNPFLFGFYPDLAFAGALPSSAWPVNTSGNNTWPQDGDMGMLSYNNNPFTTAGGMSLNFETVYEVNSYAQYSIPVPNIATPLQPILEDFFEDSNPATGFTPEVQPIGSPQVNGASLFTATTVPTISPTLTWTAPPASGPVIYNILICAPAQATDCNPNPILGGSQTGFIYSFGLYSSTSFTVPAGILTPGTTYLFFIGSEFRGGYDPLQPQRYDLPWAQAWSVSAPITVSASASPAVVHGDRFLMTAKPGKTKVSGLAQQVVGFAPTAGGKKVPAFTGWQSPFVVHAEKEPSATSYQQPATQK